MIRDRVAPMVMMLCFALLTRSSGSAADINHYSLQQDTLKAKLIFNEQTGKYVHVDSIGKVRIIQKDRSIKKNVMIREILSYWIVYEKDGSLHDMVISSIMRIEIGEERATAIYFDRSGKPIVKLNSQK